MNKQEFTFVGIGVISILLTIILAIEFGVGTLYTYPDRSEEEFTFIEARVLNNEIKLSRSGEYYTNKSTLYLYWENDGIGKTRNWNLDHESQLQKDDIVCLQRNESGSIKIFRLGKCLLNEESKEGGQITYIKDPSLAFRNISSLKLCTHEPNEKKPCLNWQVSFP